MSVRTIIIEDEKPAARKLERMLSLHSDLEIVATLHSVDEAVNWFQNNADPELIFSDIVLGDGLSFDIYDQVSTKAFIIYTTAFDEYTLKAFKLNSIDYLLKPVDEGELTKAIEKFKTFLPSESSSSGKEIREMATQQKAHLSRILVKIGYNLKVISIKDISCFYSENKMVYLQTSERAYPTDFTLDELENLLDNETFFRTNRQFIISSDYIKNISTSPVFKIELLHQPSEEITVSRDRVKNFKDWLSR